MAYQLVNNFMETQEAGIYTLEQLYSSWPEDQVERLMPGPLTSIFHSQVPILKYLDWRVTETNRGLAKSILPLNVESTNQHITHQAAVMMIAADYTGGVALATLINKVPIIGIHPQASEYGAYLWAGKADVKWIRPSCDDLVCTARIDEDKFLPLIKRFFQGSVILFEVTIEMANGDDLVAEAKITYWMQDSSALRKNAGDVNKIHPLYAHKLKTSANLIAGLRYLEQDKPIEQRLFTDNHAGATAGLRGKILAQRFAQNIPQLQSMISSRSKHCDDAIREFLSHGAPGQIVNVGVGLDTRCLRVKVPADTAIFNLDLPTMLENRRALFSSNNIAGNHKLQFDVPIDLLRQDLFEVLNALPEFDATKRTFIIWEGGSMYFPASKAMEILCSISKVMENGDSKLWVDYVDQSTVDGTSGFDVVERFIEAIRSLGEPFVNGYTHLSEQVQGINLHVLNETASNYYLNSDDPVYGLYKFALLKKG